VYADARADLRWQTLLGANFYIALDRGTPASGALGDRTIPASHTTNEVEVEDITSVLRGRAKQGLRALPEQMATALRDPAPLADLAASVARIADHATTGLRAVQGQEPASDLRELISSTAAVVGALDRPADHLRQVVAGAAATVTVTGDHSTDIRSTLEQAPAALRATDTTLQRIDGTLSELDPVVRNLQDPAPRVAPVLAGLRPTVIDARGLLNRAVPLFRALRPTSRSLASAARSGQPLLHDVAPALKQLSGKVLPYLNDVSPTTKHTTAEMIGPAIAVYANSGGLVDDVGRAIRFPLSIGSSSLYGPCQTFINNPEADKAIVCRSVTDALKTYLSYNPLGGTPGSDTGGGSARKLLKGGK
jgi:phospholipid/cholesterol/gamma-HCH transport system substrate-binding protein